MRFWRIFHKNNFASPANSDHIFKNKSTSGVRLILYKLIQSYKLKKKNFQFTQMPEKDRDRAIYSNRKNLPRHFFRGLINLRNSYLITYFPILHPLTLVIYLKAKISILSNF